MGNPFLAIVGRRFFVLGHPCRSFETIRQAPQFLSQKWVRTVRRTPPAIQAFAQKNLFRRHRFCLYLVTPNKRGRGRLVPPVRGKLDDLKV